MTGPAHDPEANVPSTGHVPALSDESRNPASSVESWFSKVTQLLGLYVIYVFVSGWAFDGFYFRALGLNTRWLDLSLSDTLVSGFMVLFASGKWVAPFYLSALGIPLFVEISSWGKRTWVRVLSMIVLVALLFPVYAISRSAGLAQAQIDKGAKSRLPVITFSSKEGKKYVGKLLYLRNDTYFIREMQSVDSVTIDSSSGIALSIYRGEDVRDVQIVTYP